MSDNTGTTVETEDQVDPYNIKIEDAGPGAKKVTVEIPQERIKQRLDAEYKTLRHDAQIPGFRKGHVPQKLLEKKFAEDIRNEVRRGLISESYKEAIEKNSLNVLGEPEFENAEAIKLPEDGPLSFSFQVEIQPEFELPEYTGLKIRKPKVSVTEEHVDQAMQNLREQQGRLLPVENRGVKENDYVIADVHVLMHGTVLNHRHNTPIVVKPGKVAGIQVDDLDKQLEGAAIGDKRTFNAKAPADHPTDSIRNQEVQIEITIKDVKELEPVTIDAEFLESLGFTEEKELRGALREQMEGRIASDVASVMRQQVVKHFIDNTKIETPAKVSERQVETVVRRRAASLMMRGIAREQVQANVERLKQGAHEEAVRELKSFFILQKLAEKLDVSVAEGELNMRIAEIAIQEGQRPEKMRQQMSKDGSLQNLYISMREEKALDEVLKTSEITEVEAKTVAEATADLALTPESPDPEHHDDSHEHHEEEPKKDESPST